MNSKHKNNSAKNYIISRRECSDGVS